MDLVRAAEPHCCWHNLAKTEIALAVWSSLSTAAFNHLQLWGCNEIMECCVHWPGIITAGCEWQPEKLNSSWLAAPPELGHWQPAVTPSTPPPPPNKHTNPHACISEWISFACTVAQHVPHPPKMSQFELILQEESTGKNSLYTHHRIWEEV